MEDFTDLELVGIIIGSVLLVLLLLVIALKVYARLTCGVCESTAKMTGKTVIITGATSGIGKETAKELAGRGARVILACRNTDTANKVKDEIVKTTGNSNVVVKRLDLSSLESVREFAAEINKSEQRLDVLIHNAGVAYTFEKAVSKDGLDMTQATNHFGPFLLTHLLIDLLKRSQPSRVVLVASELYRLVPCFNVNKINPVGFWLPAYLYYYSKYANIVFTLELARRLEGTGVTANCLHPGMVDTGIWRNVPFPLNLLLLPLIKGIFKSPLEGAQTTLHCAITPELEKVTGKYFLDAQEHGLSRGVQDRAMGRKLWELSEPLVKLQDGDPRI